MKRNDRPVPSRLRRERLTRGLRLLDVSHATGFDQSRISLIERGLRKPKAHEITAFARALGVAPRKIFPSAA